MYVIYSTFDKQWVEQRLEDGTLVFTRDILRARIFDKQGDAFNFVSKYGPSAWEPQDGDWIILYTEHVSVAGLR